MFVAKRRSSGFTLIELLIVVAIVAIIAAIAIPSLLGARTGSAAHARDQLKMYSAQLGWKVEGAACAGIDSDGDGYISCTVRVSEDGRTVDKAVECASGALLSRTEGCRLAIVRAYPQ